MNNQKIYEHVRDLLLLRDALADRRDAMGAHLAQQLAGHICSGPMDQLTSPATAKQSDAAPTTDSAAIKDDDPFGDVDTPAEGPTTQAGIDDDDIPF